MKKLIPMPPAAAVTALFLSMPIGAEPEQARQGGEPGAEGQPVDWVDCMTGSSSSRWMLYPGPSMPFGMVKLSPDNQYEDPSRHQWKAGYEYSVENIMGFSHIHSWTMNGLLTMPVTGELHTQPGPEDDPDAGYRSRFRHETETATPGYYAVTLDDYGIRAELACTTRTGFQRYTYPESGESRILFDLLFPSEYGKTVHDAKVVKVSDTEIAGFVEMSSGLHYGAVHYQDYKLHFVARTSKAFDSMDGWVGEAVSRDIGELTGKGDTGVCLNFETTQGEQILLKTGISLVSIAQARLNLETETKPFGWDFDACRHAARTTWNDLLSRVTIEGGREDDHKKFYTNFYRAYCARTIWSDVNGKYTDMFEKVQQVPDATSPVYGSDALWNTFWNLNQLWNLVTPDVSDKWVRSLLEIYDKGGWLPRGPTGIEYSGIMEASHAIPLMVAAYQHGIRGYDADKAFKAMLHSQTVPGRDHPAGGQVGNKDLTPYLAHGYIPIGGTKHDNHASNTLEYAYDDWCLAQMAKALDRAPEYKEFSKRAEFWRNLFDQETGFMRARHPDRRWLEDFDPYSRAGGWVEGNPWQYTWFVPQNLPGLVELMGRERFVERLNEGLVKSAEHDFNAPGDRMSAVPINHGNQPSMQVAYLFNHAQAPWLTQRWVRAIMDQYYGTDPHDGWPGDEDQGQGGAWFIMSALGLFQTDGGCRVDPIYEIGSPLFERAVIKLDPEYYQGKEFVIEARNNGPKNLYIQSATLNGKPLHRPWFPVKEAVNGGHLVLQMGPQPNKIWGARPEDVPRQADHVTRQGMDDELARKILQDERMDEVVRMGHELLKSGMSAGSKYSEVWIRDLNTFIVPLLDVTPQESVREALLTFFHFQGEDGNIIDGYVPKEKGHVGYRYRFSDTRPALKAHKNTVETDQESSLVQAVCRYVRKSGDRAFLDEIIRGIPVHKRMEMALEYPWFHRFSEDHLLVWGATTADWGDVQPEHKWGVELDENSHRAIDIYDNALYLVAIGEYLRTACGWNHKQTEKWTGRKESLRTAVRKHLWNETAGKFIPHIYLEESPFPAEFDENQVFYHGGTAVAIEAGLLTPDEIAMQYRKMRRNVAAANAATIGLTMFPPYPAGTFKNKAMEPYSYQNGGDWTWFGARMVRQLAVNGFVEESYRELEPMLDRVLKHDGFFEWWTPGNQPKGSGKFRGSAGVLIEAIEELRTRARTHVKEPPARPPAPKNLDHHRTRPGSAQ